MEISSGIVCTVLIAFDKGSFYLFWCNVKQMLKKNCYHDQEYGQSFLWEEILKPWFVQSSKIITQKGYYHSVQIKLIFGINIIEGKNLSELQNNVETRSSAISYPIIHFSYSWYSFSFPVSFLIYFILPFCIILSSLPSIPQRKKPDFCSSSLLWYSEPWSSASVEIWIEIIWTCLLCSFQINTFL